MKDENTYELNKDKSQETFEEIEKILELKPKNDTMTLFTEIIKCKENTKFLLDNPPNNLNLVLDFYSNLYQEQDNCQKDINLLYNKTNDSKEGQLLKSALMSTYDRIILEKRSIKVFVDFDKMNSEDLNKIVLYGGMYKKIVLDLREGETSKWDSYKDFLENKDISSDFFLNAVIFVVLFVIISVSMALSKRMSQSKNTKV